MRLCAYIYGEKNCKNENRLKVLYRNFTFFFSFQIQKEVLFKPSFLLFQVQFLISIDLVLELYIQEGISYQTMQWPYKIQTSGTGVNDSEISPVNVL